MCDFLLVVCLNPALVSLLVVLFVLPQIKYIEVRVYTTNHAYYKVGKSCVSNVLCVCVLAVHKTKFTCQATQINNAYCGKNVIGLLEDILSWPQVDLRFSCARNKPWALRRQNMLRSQQLRNCAPAICS